MSSSKAKSLSSLFFSAVKTSSKAKNSSPSSAKADVTIDRFLQSFEASSSGSVDKQLQKPKKTVSTLKKSSWSSSNDLTKKLTRDISSILWEVADVEKPQENTLEIPWVSLISCEDMSLRRKEISRERKQKWIFKNTLAHRFDKLVKMCGEKLGTETTVQVFGRLGRETGVKEYNALIGLCIEEARKSQDEEVLSRQLYKAFQLFNSMREGGFELGEETYGPFLIYLIDAQLVEEFHFFYEVIRDGNPNSVPRLGYYEMLLWIRLNNKDKIQELCNFIAVGGGEKSMVHENYFLALCASDQKEELLKLFEFVDITKVSSVDHVASIFESLGRLSLESVAKKLILACKTSDYGSDHMSHFIYSYAISLPNLGVEDIVLMYKSLHEKLELTPSLASYENLIAYCCNSLKVHMALDIADQMCEAGLTLSIKTFHSILRAIEESQELNLVHNISSMISRHNLELNSETFKSMINISVRMKDFKGAYKMLHGLKEMNLMPTAGIYNAIMAGYFREVML